MRKHLALFLILFTFLSGIAASHPAVASSGWKAISAGGQNTCGIRNDETAWCWGWGYDGEGGNGLRAQAQTVPVMVGK